MKKSVRLNHISFFISLIPFLFQLSSVAGSTFYYRFGYLAILLMYLIFSKNLKISKYYIETVIIISLVYIGMPIISLDLNVEAITYYGMIAIFLLVATIVSENLNKDPINSHKNLLISNSILLLLKIIQSINQINEITIMSVFTGDRFNRASFGFSHPNFAAMFIVMEILMAYNAMRKRALPKKLGIFIIICCVLPLFSTGSRSALYSLIVFFLSELLFVFLKIFKKYRKMIFVLLFGLGIWVGYKEFATELIIKSSGRYEIILHNIQVLINNGNILFGSGGGSTSNIRNIDGIEFSDNWYMTIVLNYGLFGLVIMLVGLVVIFMAIYKRNFSTDSFVISIMIMMIFYSFAENMLFVPGVALSWYFWCIVMAALKQRSWRINNGSDIYNSSSIQC